MSAQSRADHGPTENDHTWSLFNKHVTTIIRHRLSDELEHLVHSMVEYLELEDFHLDGIHGLVNLCFVTQQVAGSRRYIDQSTNVLLEETQYELLLYLQKHLMYFQPEQPNFWQDPADRFSFIAVALSLLQRSPIIVVINDRGHISANGQPHVCDNFVFRANVQGMYFDFSRWLGPFAIKGISWLDFSTLHEHGFYIEDKYLVGIPERSIFRETTNDPLSARMRASLDPDFVNFYEERWENSPQLDFSASNESIRLHHSPFESAGLQLMTGCDRRLIDGPRGMKVAMYDPPVEGLLPLAILAHGGGGVWGDHLSNADIASRMCLSGSARVAVPGYSLAPEHPFPAAYEDMVAFLRYALQEGNPLQINTTIVLVGFSSGAALAAALAVYARSRGIEIHAQVLVNPVLSLAETMWPGSEDAVCLTPERMRFYTKHYLQGHDRTDWRVSPIYAKPEQVRGVAQALIIVSDQDMLASSGRAFAVKLITNGVKTTVQTWPGAPHDIFEVAGAVPLARRAVDSLVHDFVSLLS